MLAQENIYLLNKVDKFPHIPVRMRGNSSVSCQKPVNFLSQANALSRPQAPLSSDELSLRSKTSVL